MKKYIRKLSLALAVCLCMSMFSGVAAFAYSGNVSYAPDIDGGRWFSSENYPKTTDKARASYPDPRSKKVEKENVRKTVARKKVKKNLKNTKKVTNRIIGRTYEWNDKKYTSVTTYKRKTVTKTYKNKIETTTVRRETIYKTYVFPHFKKKVSVDRYAPRAGEKVREAFKKKGWKLYHSTRMRKPSKNADYWDDVTTGMTIQNTIDGNYVEQIIIRIPETVYHELGHFIALEYGRPDLTDEFKAIQKEEMNLADNPIWATGPDPAVEYFAECYAYYCENPKKMKKVAPKSYVYLVKQLKKI